MATSTRSDSRPETPTHAAAPAESVEERVIDAALRCIARWGVAKTTIDDVAREAGCSRATIYRVFDGGKEGILAAVVDHELERLLGQLAEASARAEDLEDVLVAGLTTGARFIVGHDALRFLVAHELDVVLPLVAFDRMDAVLTRLGHAAEPWFAPHLDGRDARLVAEWMVRLVLTYTALPSDTIDLTNEASARRLVRRYVLPGLTVGAPAPT